MYPEFGDYFWSNLELTFNLRDENAKVNTHTHTHTLQCIVYVLHCTRMDTVRVCVEVGESHHFVLYPVQWCSPEEPVHGSE